MWPLWLNSRLIEYSVVPGRTFGIADGHRADALRGGDVPLEQQRRRLQRGRRCCRSRSRAPSLGSQLGHVDVERRADREPRCHTRCGSGDAPRSGPACCCPSQARSSEPASQVVKPTYSASGRVRHALGRHRADAQLAEHAFPGCGVRQQVVEAGRLEVHRSLGRRLACGCCDSRRSSCSTTRDISPPRPPRRIARRLVPATLRRVGAADCAGGARRGWLRGVPVPVCASNMRCRRRRAPRPSAALHASLLVRAGARVVDFLLPSRLLLVGSCRRLLVSSGFVAFASSAFLRRPSGLAAAAARARDRRARDASARAPPRSPPRAYPASA